MRDEKESVMFHPKVSIVIPVYNGENYLKEAIDSALAQTYDNCEIIVVNDGSTDRTEEICKEYGDKIRYFKKENGGVSSALNLGVKKMRGEYFSWLSHDDTYEPQKIATNVAFIQEHRLMNQKVILFSDYCAMDKHGNKFYASHYDVTEMARRPEYIIAKTCINGLSLLIPKSAFVECGGFDEKLSCVQDYDLWLRMSKTYKFVFIPEALVNMRCHDAQVTKTSPKVAIEGNQFYINLVKNIPQKRRCQLGGSEYCFFEELADFYMRTDMLEAASFCREEAKKILETKKDTEKKKVSVIIPFEKQNDELKTTVQSVLNQSHQNFEVLLVGEERSNLTKRMQDYIGNDERIKVIKMAEDFSFDTAYMNGIESADGDYVAFLKPGDEWDVDKLKMSLQYALVAKAEIVHTSYSQKEDGTTVHKGLERGRYGNKIYCCYQLMPSTIMIDRKWIIKDKKWNNAIFAIGSEMCFWLEVLKSNEYLVGIDAPLACIAAKNYNIDGSNLDEKKNNLKCLICYLLNDEYYSQYAKEIELFMREYLKLSPQESDFEKELKKNYQLRDKNRIQKTLFFIKDEGIGSLIKRAYGKILSR